MKKILKKFKFQLFISILTIILFSTCWLYFYSEINKKENTSDILLNNFNIEQLYSNSKNYTMLESNTSEKYSIIGIIEIPKINIKYPILSEINDELLKIAIVFLNFFKIFFIF